MDWIRLHNEDPCDTCGTDTQRWVRVMQNARRIGEITFCPACSPQTSYWVAQKNPPTKPRQE